MSAVQRIEARVISSKFGSGSDVELLIDGEKVEHLLGRVITGRGLEELVCCWGGNFESPLEWVLTRKRMTLLDDSGMNVPLLNCPDDADLCCSVLMTEVFDAGEWVEWRRLGFNQANLGIGELEKIGEEVSWFDGVEKFRFAQSDYLKAVQICVEEGDRSFE